MVGFPQFVARLYALNIAVTDESPVTAASKLMCMDFCAKNKTCSAFLFNSSKLACYILKNWIKQPTAAPPENGYDYYVMEQETCSSPDYQYLSNVGLCLKFSTDFRNWTTARDTCVMEGARLLKIDTKEKNDAIWSKLNTDYPSKSFLMGAHDPEKNSHWKWTDGSDLVFTDWTPGQPTNESYISCGQLWSGHGWDDISCRRNELYICEKI